jgi:hypothetical protein
MLLNSWGDRRGPRQLPKQVPMAVRQARPTTARKSRRHNPPRCGVRRALVEPVMPMFRISKTDQPRRSVLILEGSLSEECVETVNRCCLQAVARGVPVDLYLRDVTEIGENARALLRNVARLGVRLRGAGVYTSYILRGLNPGNRESEKP